jgi:uncharacterized protein (DUF2147 family)
MNPKTPSAAADKGVAHPDIAAMQSLLLGDSMTSRFGTVIAVLATFLLSATSAIAAADVSGIWLTQAGDAKVRVSKCGSGICGVLVWLKDPINRATGKPEVDDKNPKPALAKRPMIGLPLFSGMRATGPGKWSGTIYNADNGNSYASTVSLLDPDALRVEGCIGVLCGGETWTRSTR